MAQMRIVNGRVLTPEGWIENGTVVIEKGKIVSVEAGTAAGGEVFDAKGCMVTPGLCDIHIHGSGGFWGFSTVEDVLGMSRALLRNGVTSFCPATVSLPHKDVLRAIGVIREAMGKQSAGRDFEGEPAEGEGARILGINLEGPYISMEKPGAHNPMCIRDPKPEEVEEVVAAAGDALRLATIAPEIKGGMDFVRGMAGRGVVVSIGHSNATGEQVAEAVKNGARLMTHLFNAMRGFHQREPGVAFAGLLDPALKVEIIADGHHVHPDNVALAVRLAGAERVVLVTDAISAAGMPDGEYGLWGFKVQVSDGKCLLPNGTFAGSVLTLNKAVSNIQKFSEMDSAAAFRCATSNPLGLLGLAGKVGTIKAGMAADIAVFDGEMGCRGVFVGGEPRSIS